MKRSISYRTRCLLLVSATMLLVAVMWNKRLSGSIAQWRMGRELEHQLAEGGSHTSRIQELRAELQEIDVSLGDLELSADAVWQRVLTQIADGASGEVDLHGIDGEIIVHEDGSLLHILPVTLQGSFSDLIRTTNELQRTVPEAHPISIRFRTERVAYDRQRILLMTLYLQKIVNDHA